MATKLDTYRSPQGENQPTLIIDAGQYERLAGLAAEAARRIPVLGERLLEEIERAQLLPPEQVPPDVVTIGSEVTYEDSSTARTQTVQIVFPALADIAARRVSVLTPVGAALIGLSVGQSIDWEMSDGAVRKLTVLDVSRPETPAASGG